MAERADSVVVELVARTQQYDAAVAGSARSFEAAASRTTKAANDVEVSTGRMANAQRNLGRQVADVGAQLAGGQSPFLILAQQAPQVADALADTGGKAAKVASFFAGPWGAAFLAAASVGGVLIGKLIETSKAEEDLVAKLEENERKARAADAAQDAFSRTLLGGAKAAREMNAELTAQNRSLQENQRAALNAAEAQRQINIQKRQETADRLRARLVDARNAATPGFTGARDDGGFGQAAVQARADRRVTEAANDYAIAQQAVADATNAVIQARIPLLNGQAEARSTQQGRLTREHADQLVRLKQEYEAASRAAAKLPFGAERTAAIDAANERYTAGVAGANQRLAGSLEAISDGKKAATKAEREAASAAKSAAKEAARDLAELQKAAANVDEALAKFFRPAPAMKDWADIFRGVGPSGPTDLGDFRRDEAEKDRKFEADKQRKQAAYNEDEKNIRSLASIYESAFRGGSGNIWDTFKEEGLKAVALILARFTVLQLAAAKSGSGGGILANLASAASSVFTSKAGIPARASGGPVAAGQLYRVNEGASPGRVEGFRPQGSGTIIPLGQMRAASPGGGVTVLQTVNVDAKGAVMNDEFAAMILERSGQQAAFAAQYSTTQSRDLLRQTQRPRLPGSLG